MVKVHEAYTSSKANPLNCLAIKHVHKTNYTTVTFIFIVCAMAASHMTAFLRFPS